MANQADLDNWYEYHAPNIDQAGKYLAIRNKAKELAELFNDSVKECADKSAAHRDLRNAVMAMNLAISCNSEE